MRIHSGQGQPSSKPSSYIRGSTTQDGGLQHVGVCSLHLAGHAGQQDWFRRTARGRGSVVVAQPRMMPTGRRQSTCTDDPGQPSRLPSLIRLLAVPIGALSSVPVHTFTNHNVSLFIPNLRQTLRKLADYRDPLAKSTSPN